MFTQDDIDAVLNQAQTAVDALAEDVGELDRPAMPAAPREGRGAQTAVPSVRQPKVGANGRNGQGLVERLRRLKVPLVVRLAQRRMSLEEVMKMVPGTMVEFDRMVDHELDLMVNNHQIGAGVAVKVDEHFGIRVTYLGDIRERIQSLKA